MQKFFIFFLLTIFISCDEPEVQITKIENDRTPFQRGENISVNYTDSGELRAKLYSPLLEHYRFDAANPFVEMKQGVKVFFYAKENKERPESMLKSKYAIRYENQGKIILKNDVVVVNIYHDTLNTELLIWNENTKRISSDKFVRIKKKDEILFGEGFESNEDFTQYRIFKIKGSILRKSDEIQ